MRGFAFIACVGVLVACQASRLAGQTAAAPGHGPHLAPPAASYDPSGARRFLADAGELVTLYGARRFDPYYEPGRLPTPTDPETGWPVNWDFAPFLPVGGPNYSPYAYRYSPYGYGFYRSFYRPRYVPYGYGYGWGYRYPFGYSPWSAYRWNYYRPWYGYGLDRPWYAPGAYGWHSPYVDYGPSFLDAGPIVAPHADYGGSFYW